MARKPKTFVCASAIGYYGDGGDGILTERSPKGEGFLAEVCEGWEGAAQPAIDAGRVYIAYPTGQRQPADKTAGHHEGSTTGHALLCALLATGDGLTVSVNSPELSLELLLNEDLATDPTAATTTKQPRPGTEVDHGQGREPLRHDPGAHLCRRYIVHAAEIHQGLDRC